MAITVNGAAFLALAIRRGVVLGDLVTIGRQGLYAPKAMLNEYLVRGGRPPAYVLAAGDPGYPEKGEWADDLYRHFGARELSILDGSAYEGAGLVHDLNQKLPPHLENRFDCLIDGGSLEHVFNVPEALSSYMRMVRMGGHVILLDMPATNLCGHGFYQFSPALFWQVFSPDHGFRVVEMVVAEGKPFAEFWRVQNPSEYGRRVELVHDKPCHIYLVAQKCGASKGFEGSFPVQHDYTTAWGGTAPVSRFQSHQPGIMALARRIFAKLAPNFYWKLSNARNGQRQLRTARLGDVRAPYTRM